MDNCINKINLHLCLHVCISPSFFPFPIFTQPLHVHKKQLSHLHERLQHQNYTIHHLRANLTAQILLANQQKKRGDELSHILHITHQREQRRKELERRHRYRPYPIPTRKPTTPVPTTTEPVTTPPPTVTTSTTTTAAPTTTTTSKPEEQKEHKFMAAYGMGFVLFGAFLGFMLLSCCIIAVQYRQNLVNSCNACFGYVVSLHSGFERVQGEAEQQGISMQQLQQAQEEQEAREAEGRMRERLGMAPETSGARRIDCTHQESLQGICKGGLPPRPSEDPTVQYWQNVTGSIRTLARSEDPSLTPTRGIPKGTPPAKSLQEFIQKFHSGAERKKAMEQQEGSGEEGATSERDGVEGKEEKEAKAQGEEEEEEGSILGAEEEEEDSPANSTARGSVATATFYLSSGEEEEERDGVMKEKNATMVEGEK